MELVYTSAPSGLKQGSRGFCTVISSAGMPINLAQRLEALSGYRHVFPPQDSRAKENPVCYSHLRMNVGGKLYSVLSRISNYGLDYSHRSNKLAHHLLLESNKGTSAGPAWLMQQVGVMLESWDGVCATLNIEKQLPNGSLQPAVCNTWKRLAGDAGWAGVAVDAWVKPTAAKLIWIIFELQNQQQLLQLMNEAIALLPESKRWQATFSTYFTNMPPDVDCRVRCVLAGTDEARLAPARGTVIDLTKPSICPLNSPEIEAARTGLVTASEARSGPPIPQIQVEIPATKQQPQKPTSPAPRTTVPPELDLLLQSVDAPATQSPIFLPHVKSAYRGRKSKRAQWMIIGSLSLAAFLVVGALGAYACVSYFSAPLARLPKPGLREQVASDLSQSAAIAEQEISSGLIDVQKTTSKSDVSPKKNQERTDGANNIKISFEPSDRVKNESVLECPEVVLSNKLPEYFLAKVIMEPIPDVKLFLKPSDDRLLIRDGSIFRLPNPNIKHDPSSSSYPNYEIIAMSGDKKIGSFDFRLFITDADNETISELRLVGDHRVFETLKIEGDVTDEDHPNVNFNRQFEIVVNNVALPASPDTSFSVRPEWEDKDLYVRLKYNASKFFNSSAAKTNTIHIEKLAKASLDFDEFISGSSEIDVNFDLPLERAELVDLRIGNESILTLPKRATVKFKSGNSSFDPTATIRFNSQENSLNFKFQFPRGKSEFTRSESLAAKRTSLIDTAEKVATLIETGVPNQVTISYLLQDALVILRPKDRFTKSQSILELIELTMLLEKLAKRATQLLTINNQSEIKKLDESISEIVKGLLNTDTNQPHPWQNLSQFINDRKVDQPSLSQLVVDDFAVSKELREGIINKGMSDLLRQFCQELVRISSEKGTIEGLPLKLIRKPTSNLAQKLGEREKLEDEWVHPSFQIDVRKMDNKFEMAINKLLTDL